jgi:hypothetical protein
MQLHLFDDRRPGRLSYSLELDSTREDRLALAAATPQRESMH